MLYLVYLFYYNKFILITLLCVIQLKFYSNTHQIINVVFIHKVRLIAKYFNCCLNIILINKAYR
jgi:hypothetical protein